MEREEVTILRVHKGTRERLRKRALAKRESYDEIINRLLGEQEAWQEGDDLERRKQKLLGMGISKELVDLVGVLPKNDVEDDRRVIAEAIKAHVSRKRQ